MRFKSLILSAGLLVSIVGAANASSNWFGVNAGAGVPMGDYSDAAATGYQFGVTGTRMMNDQWGFGADVNYHMWNGSDEANSAAELAFGSGSEFKWSALQATANVMMNIPSQGMMSPYLKGGLGLYNVSFKLESPSGDMDTSESKLGFNFGGGMNFASSGNMRWGVNAAYHVVPAEEDLGSDLNAMTFGLNVMWGVGN